MCLCSRPLPTFPVGIVYLDCIYVKVHQDKRVIKKAVYLASGINMAGKKELLGMWMSDNELLHGCNLVEHQQ